MPRYARMIILRVTLPRPRWASASQAGVAAGSPSAPRARRVALGYKTGISPPGTGSHEPTQNDINPQVGEVSTGIRPARAQFTNKRKDVVEFYLYLAARLTVIRRLINRVLRLYRWPTRPTTRRLR